MQLAQPASRRKSPAAAPSSFPRAVRFTGIQFQAGKMMRSAIFSFSLVLATEPQRTQILGNFRQDYATKPIRCDAYPWWDRVVMKSHIEIECHPQVWKRVESLIRSKFPPPARATSAQSSPHQSAATLTNSLR